MDPAIRFTVEGNQENGFMPFLDTLVKPEADIFLVCYCVLQAYPYWLVPEVG